MIISENRDIRTLAMVNQKAGGGGHSVAPYEIKKDNSAPGRWRIYVYDSNNPGSNSSYILIDSTFNWWGDRFTPLLSWSGNKGLFLVPLN